MEKNTILEPIESITRIILLKYAPENSKLSLYNNKVIIQEPSYFQSLSRTYWKDSREDLYFLYQVIYKFIFWYILIPNGNILNGSKEIRILSKLLIDALTKLQNTYKIGNIVLTLQFYKNLVSDALRNNIGTDKLPNINITNDSLIDDIKLKNLWRPSELEQLINLLDKCEDTKNKDDIETYINGLNGMLESKNKNFTTMLANCTKTI